MPKVAFFTFGILREERDHPSIQEYVDSYRIPSSGVLFVPALDEHERQVVGRYWRDFVNEDIPGIHQSVEFNIDDFSPWWCLPTPASMAAMCAAAGFRVVEGGYSWGGNAYTILLEPSRP